MKVFKKVFSPYFRNGVNPNFPYGCSKARNARILSMENPLVKKISWAKTQEEKEELKRAKHAS